MRRVRAELFTFTTTWRVAAASESVWEAIYRSEEWPRWWPGLERVDELVRGAGEGEGNVRRYVWRGALPYRVAFIMRVVRVERPVRLEGVADGDVCGTGRWRLTPEPSGTRVDYIWRVRLRRPWMQRLSPLARPLFDWNHAVVMQRGATGLSRWLGVTVTADGRAPVLGAATPDTEG